MWSIFNDRTDAGRRLATALAHHRNKPNTIVLGLPRGGVVTAAAIAEELDLPLDVLVVRKLGTPGHEELAMGAVGPGGVRVLNDDVIAMCGVSRAAIDAATRAEKAEVERRQQCFRGSLPPLDVRNKNVIVVDDGLATGATMAAAIEVLRRHEAARIVLAVPVAPAETCERLRRLVDELVCLERPEPFEAIGYWYADFAQVSDDEVVDTLARLRSRVAGAV